MKAEMLFFYHYTVNGSAQENNKKTNRKLKVACVISVVDNG